MDMNAPLPCGTLPTELLDVGRPDATASGHDHATCEHCSTQLAQSRSLFALLDRATSVDVPTPTDLAHRVLASVRGGPSGSMVVARTAQGLTSVSDRVARSLVEQALLGRTDAWLRQCRVTPGALTSARRIELDLELVPVGPLHTAATTIRDAVRTTLDALLGESMPVDIRVVGLLPLP